MIREHFRVEIEPTHSDKVEIYVGTTPNFRTALPQMSIDELRKIREVIDRYLETTKEDESWVDPTRGY